VLVRQGQTEGSVDLSRLAGLDPSAVICEIMNEDGTMSRLPDLEKFAEKHGLLIASVNDLVAYRWSTEMVVEEVSQAAIELEEFGTFTAKVFKSSWDDSEHVAFIKTPIDMSEPVLVRLHSECLTGDTFGSMRCDCGWQRRESLARIAEKGGVMLYMRQEGRGIGLANKIKAYALQDEGLDTVEANHKLGFEADHRHYGMSAQMLQHLGIDKIRLLTNNPRKVEELRAFGLSEVTRVPLEMPPTKQNKEYLKTKSEKMGHHLQLINE
jgi:3,4-dihydroxy 2-butanone 4-phosphate synthase/GTP cyclohydrolase II